MVGRSIVGEEGWNIVEYTLIRLPWHHRIPNRWRRNAERSQVWPNMYRIWTEGNERDRIKIHHNEGRTVDEKKRRGCWLEDQMWRVWVTGWFICRWGGVNGSKSNQIQFWLKMKPLAWVTRHHEKKVKAKAKGHLEKDQFLLGCWN